MPYKSEKIHLSESQDRRKKLTVEQKNGNSQPLRDWLIFSKSVGKTI